MEFENIPEELKERVEDLRRGSATIEALVNEAIEQADNWKDAQSNIKASMDSLIQEAQETKVDLGGAEEVILEGWSIADIKSQAEDDGHEITDEQAINILRYLKQHFDATIGINWEVISSAIAEELSN